MLVANQLEKYNDVKINLVPYSAGNDRQKAKEIAATIAKSDAVIGQSSIETLDAAGSVYDQASIPVINVIPVTTRLTESHPYFSTSPILPSRKRHISRITSAESTT